MIFLAAANLAFTNKVKSQEDGESQFNDGSSGISERTW